MKLLAISAVNTGPVLEITLNRPTCATPCRWPWWKSCARPGAGRNQRGQRPATRVVVLRGAGGHFCAGGDLKDMAMARMRAMGGPGDGTDPLPKSTPPLAACVPPLPTRRWPWWRCWRHGDGRRPGPGLRGRRGHRHRTASFRLPETSLGVVPAQIAPFLVERLGYSQAKRLAVTGGKLDAAQALRIGLVHQQIGHRRRGRRAAGRAGRHPGLRPWRPGRHQGADGQGPLERPAALVDEAAALFSPPPRAPRAREGTGAFLQKRKPTLGSRMSFSKSDCEKAAHQRRKPIAWCAQLRPEAFLREIHMFNQIPGRRPAAHCLPASHPHRPNDFR